jgi:Domain of unknown function (DUF397)
MANGTDIPALVWFKSSKSSANGQCTMCARLPDGGMAVTDSQHPASPVLRFSATQWRAFIQDIKRDDPN